MIAAGQMYWTKAVTDAIIGGGTFGLQQLEQQNTKELLEEVKLVRGNLTHLVGGTGCLKELPIKRVAHDSMLN